MFLETSDVHIIVNCFTDQEYDIHKIQLYIVLISVHHKGLYPKQ